MNNPSIKIKGSPQPEFMLSNYQRFFIEAKKITRPIKNDVSADCGFFENQPLRLGTYGTGLVEDSLLRCVNFAFR
jgi:hypothetical protein